MANQHTKLPYNTTSGAVPSAYSAENDNGIKAGELAVNLYQGQEFLVTRNENGDVIKFSSDNLALFEKGSGANSIQQKGTSCTASGDKSFAMGDGTTASGYCAYAEGSQTSGSGNYSHAEGTGTAASGMGSHAEGNQTKAFGDNSHAEGYKTAASGESSHAEGRQTSALTEAAHAEGNGTTASGSSSHAEGNGTHADGNYSHAEGNGTTASGNRSHAEGNATTANGVNSHTEGDKTTTVGGSAHAEGSGTTASGICSHAEGNSTQALQANTHAEGSQTIASGSASHAEGLQTQALGKQSHTEGNGTIASNENEHASGAYNKSHVSGATEWDDLQGTTSSTDTVESFTGTSTLFSVGFGESGSTRNALEVTRQGQTLLNSRKTYFRYADASADMGDQSYAATGATQYQTTPGVAEYITMFDIIEKVRGNDKHYETKTISSTTGASSLSGITSGLGVSDGTKMIFINNSAATGDGVVYISSTNTMVDGQKITLYFTNPQQIRAIDTNYDGITIYGHYNGNVETFLVGKASRAMNFKTSIIEIIKLGNNSFIVEFRNTTSGTSGT